MYHKRKQSILVVVISENNWLSDVTSTGQGQEVCHHQQLSRNVFLIWIRIHFIVTYVHTEHGCPRCLVSDADVHYTYDLVTNVNHIRLSKCSSHRMIKNQ